MNRDPYDTVRNRLWSVIVRFVKATVTFFSRLAGLNRSAGQLPKPLAVNDWYKISWNDTRIRLDVRRDRPWTAEIRWSDIETICLKMEPDAYLGVSNGLYIWVAGREHSYAIPFDAENGWELVQELPGRGKFPPKLLITAMGSTDGVYCWPKQK